MDKFKFSGSPAVKRAAKDSTHHKQCSDMSEVRVAQYIIKFL